MCGTKHKKTLVAGVEKWITPHHKQKNVKLFLCEENVITIKSPQFVLCNYFPCRIRIFDNKFSSSEQAYQWCYLKYIGMDELAQEVLDASSEKEAKDIASRAPGTDITTGIQSRYV